MEDVTIATLIAIASPFIAAGLSYGGMKASVKSIQLGMAELTKKIVEVEKDTSKRVSELEKDKAAHASVFGVEKQLSAIDVTVATLKNSHEELNRRHADGMAEVRNRASALEGRTSSLEQNNAELRVQLQNVIQTTARIEAKQDRDSEAIADLHRNFLDFFAGEKSPAAPRPRARKE